MVITMLEDIKGIGPKSLLALKALNLYTKMMLLIIFLIDIMFIHQLS